MNLHRYLTGFLLAILISAPAFGQKRDLVVQADKVFAIGEYHRAIEKYKKAYSKEKDTDRKTALSYKIAHCYRLINDPKRAETYYSRVVRRKFNDPKANLYYARVLRMNGKLDNARAAYEEYLKLEPADTQALTELMACDSAINWINNPTRYQIENIKDFNTKFNDYSPFFASSDYKELYISSSREGGKGAKLHGGTGQAFSDIYYTRLDNKQKWAVPTALDNTINSPYDDGAPWVAPNGSTMYFTRCRFDKQEALGCQVLMTKRQGAKWSDPVVLPIAKDSMVVAHPSLTGDELTMFFTSDMLGGYGGKDIWMVKRESASGAFGSPVNLGPEINTPGNEMFPFVKSDSLFYFSSDGHPGIGGLDIFKATLTNEGIWVVENMKHPINSLADDFGIIFQSDEEQGYFVSSRAENARGGDDIYSFFLPGKVFNLTGRVINEKTTLPLGAAEVRLIGSDGNSLEYTTDSTGLFSFKLKPETDYLLVAFKRGFLNGKMRETTKGLENSRDFETTLVLAPYEKPIELPNILYDLARWDLRPESMVALDGLIETLEDNPNITIELMSHTDVRPFRTMTNLELSQNRAQSVVDYLISKGIETDRLTARGYGPDVPRVVDEKIAEQYPFLALGDTLAKEFIDKLANEQSREIAHQLNRRTEFRVVRTDYVPRDQKPGDFDAKQQILLRGLEELQQGQRNTERIRNLKQGEDPEK
ncbi:MAG: OmpA family protein [Bacteroidales bacterium]